MKPRRRALSIALALLSTLNLQLFAVPLGTAFNYQGKLMDGTNAANGIYDFRFAIYDAAESGAQIGLTLTNAAVAVSNGLFAVTLDFGPAAFNGDARWLEIGVRRNGVPADFTVLWQRQPISPTPYASFTPKAGKAEVAQEVVDGSITEPKIAEEAVKSKHLAPGAVNASKIADGAVTAGKVAAGQVVKSLNALRDDVTLAAGTNVTLNTNGQTLTISSSAAGVWNQSGTNISYTVGHVGIGTNDPQSALHVAGTVTAGAFVGSGAYLTSLSGAALTAGSVSNAVLAADAVTSDKITDGTIAASDLNPTLLSNTFWSLAGNAGTTPGMQFLGTTDGQPLEFRVNGQRALRLEYARDELGRVCVNVIAGSSGTSASAGSTIAGGTPTRLELTPPTRPSAVGAATASRATRCVRRSAAAKHS